uniref:UDP-hexose transferase n=1 Tax=Bradyrhizobium japonicum TaxID=375 RepID=O52496_BRAJP|nr:UDP-hexose transferase [Bradyrhizobium japonicum]
MITAEDVLDLPVSARVATQARLPLPVGSTTSVSVVIPAKNVAAYVGETLASALAQGEVTEVIVVDDGSTDNTIAIVRAIRDPRLRLMTNDSAGVSAARNLGARHASGEWLLFLDTDDRLRPGAVAALLARSARSARRPRLRRLQHDRQRGTAGRPARPLERTPQALRRRADAARGQQFHRQWRHRLARAEAFRAIGGFDTSLRYCEDWHCWCRLAAIGEFEFAPKLLLDYRLHTANTMNAAVRTPQDFFPAIARVFDDGLILARLPEGTAARLRQAAEIHLVTYSAMQAVRFGRYRQAFTYLGMVGRRSLKSLARSGSGSPSPALAFSPPPRVRTRSSRPHRASARCRALPARSRARPSRDASRRRLLMSPAGGRA